jgi:hypothetical protein
MTPTSSSPGDPWALVEQERRRDGTMRRLCIVAWSFTIGLAVLAAIAVTMSVVQVLRQSGAFGVMTWGIIVGSMWPLIAMLWTLGLLAAALSTVGVFLRHRTASLTEIQLRLATLERMLTERGDRA